MAPSTEGTLHAQTAFRGWLVCLLALGALTSVTFGGSHSFGQVCFTEAHERGRCVPVKQCASIAATLRKAEHTNEDMQLVYGSECGRTADGKALVCCVQGSPMPPTTETTPSVATGVRVNDGATDAAGTPVGGLLCGAQRGAREISSEGVRRSIGFHPWTVLLHYGNRPYEIKFPCVGTLISAQHVLTTAGCVAEEETWANLTVRVGEYDLESSVDCLSSSGDEDGYCANPSYDVPVAQVVLHERFDSVRNDIALLTLSRPVELNDWVGPICLPEAALVDERATYYAAGWNQNTCEDGTRHKLEHSYGVTNQTACRRRLPADGRAGHSFVCVSSPGQPFAQDTGAALTKTVDGGALWSRSVHELVGLLSSTTSCANYEGVLVYTKVGQHLDWIRDKRKPSNGGR